MKRILALLLSGSLLFASADEIIICENGTEMLAWDLDFVCHAEKSIEISACFFGGDVLQDLLHTIESRMEERPELIVHILTTPILMEERDEALISQLEAKFPERFHLVHAYNVLTMEPVGCIDNHMKLFVVDEKYYSMGGSNLDDIAISEGTIGIDAAPHCKKVPVELPSGSRDQDLVGKGEMAKELRVIFFKMYAIWELFNEERRLSELNPECYQTKWFPVEANTVVEDFDRSEDLIPLEKEEFKIILGGPHQPTNAITNAYVELLSQAKKEVLIANLYFNPPKPIFDLIKKAAVPFKIVTNGVRKSSPKCNNMYCWAHRVNYVPALYGKNYRFWEKSHCERDHIQQVELFEYDVKNVVLHKKAMVVDDEVVVIGSYNLGSKSDQCDYELIAVIRSKKAACALKKVLKRDFEHSAKISPEEARSWYFDIHTAYIGELQKDFNGFV